MLPLNLFFRKWLGIEPAQTDEVRYKKYEADKVYDFYVREYENHRRHLLEHMSEERKMERNIMVACGIFYSWLSTKIDNGVGFVGMMAALPVAATIFSYFRARTIANGVRVKAEYLRQLESQVLVPDAPAQNKPIGWEQFIQAFEKGNYSKKYDHSLHGFWLMFILAALVVGGLFVVLAYQCPDAPAKSVQIQINK